MISVQNWRRLRKRFPPPFRCTPKSAATTFPVRCEKGSLSNISGRDAETDVSVSSITRTGLCVAVHSEQLREGNREAGKGRGEGARKWQREGGMSTWNKLREFYENGKFYLAERKRRKEAEKGRLQVVSADNVSSEDELTPTSASSFDAEQEALSNPLRSALLSAYSLVIRCLGLTWCMVASGKEALSKYFGFLGASRFRDAAQVSL